MRIVPSLSSNRHCPNRFHCIVNPRTDLKSRPKLPVVEYAAPLFYVAVKDGDKGRSGCEGPRSPERSRTVGDLLERLTTLQVGIVLIGEGLGSSIDHLLLVLRELLVVDGDLGGSKSGSSDELLY